MNIIVERVKRESCHVLSLKMTHKDVGAGLALFCPSWPPRTGRLELSRLHFHTCAPTFLNMVISRQSPLRSSGMIYLV